MKIVLATGIYPPDIGGPATYVRALAQEITKRGVEVTVVTYGEIQKYRNTEMQKWNVVWVSKSGGPLLRWQRYAKALREHAAQADAIIAFSSVSCGVPLWLARLKVPKKILRLGGDFFWERYTDHGGMKGLREWYRSWFQVSGFRFVMGRLLRTFDHVVFSTGFQQEIYEKHYRHLPPHSVLENAIPESEPAFHKKHEPLRLLYLGRLVGFKNLPNLIRAVEAVCEPPLRRSMTLTIVGDGPLLEKLKSHASCLKSPVTFLPPAHGAEVHRLFSEHDLLVLPSLTEISPNVALEARAYGLPVLLTKETGLSTPFTEGMLLREMNTAEQIQSALLEVLTRYDMLAARAAKCPPNRSWGRIADEFLALLSPLT